MTTTLVFYLGNRFTKRILLVLGQSTVVVFFYFSQLLPGFKEKRHEIILCR